VLLDHADNAPQANAFQFTTINKPVDVTSLPSVLSSGLSKPSKSPTTRHTDDSCWRV